jgi:hypothetical protein
VAPRVWQDDALCKAFADQHGTDVADRIFFADNSNPSGQEKARRICMECPVWQQCLAYSVANDIEFGLWGGTTADERREVRPGYVEDMEEVEVAYRKLESQVYVRRLIYEAEQRVAKEVAAS